MSGAYISKELRRKVAEQARHRCGFCLTAELTVGSLMDVDHIVPEAASGLTEENNLWLCCAKCNGHKADKTSGLDPQTGELTNLFNPRTQSWAEHFEWSENGEFIAGRTPVGRATVVTLQLNRAELVASRQLWIRFGIHPPQD